MNRNNETLKTHTDARYTYACALDTMDLLGCSMYCSFTRIASVSFCLIFNGHDYVFSTHGGSVKFLAGAWEAACLG